MSNVNVWGIPTSPVHSAPIVHELKTNPFRYERTSWDRSFPLLTDLEVQKQLGKRGTMFAKEIHQLSFFDKQEKKLIGVIYFPTTCEGPPGKVHGGALASIIDMLFGWQAVRNVGLGCVTGNLNVTYHHFVPLEAVVRFEIWTEKIEGRKIYMRGKLTSNIYSIGEDTQHKEIVHNEAHALFVKQKGTTLSYEEALELFGPNSKLSKEQLIEMLKEERRKRKQQSTNENLQSKL